MMDCVVITKLKSGYVLSEMGDGEDLMACSTFAEVLSFLRGVFEPTPPNTLADETLLSDLPLSCRTANCLINNEGIKTVEELRRMTESEVLRVPGLGRKSLNELKEMGVRFGTLDPLPLGGT